MVLHASVEDGRLSAGEGPSPRPDLVIETGPALKGLLAGELLPAEAIASGQVKLTGDASLLSRFVEVFRIA